MAKANNKRIEEAATTALKAALLLCPLLDSYVDSNDKTPSWDGTVFVYRNEVQKKSDLVGRVPIQIKGTETVLVGNEASFSCSVSDLRNYYNDGGCIFFLISVNPSNGSSRIYYASLLVYDLKKALNDAGKQKNKTIKLSSFPVNDTNEMSAIFLSFIENSRKQMSFIGKELPSLEQLEKSGVSIESLTFNTSGFGLDLTNIGNYISSHDFYLYAKPKGVDVEIPVDKVKNAIVSRTISGKVCVKNVEYYSEYRVVSQKGRSQFQIGKGISLSLNEETQKMTLSFKASGTLSDYILDGRFFVAAVENAEITLNGGKLPFNDADNIDLSDHKERLHYYEDIKKMLDILGVTEELQISQLSQNDEKNIRNFVNAILYNKKIGFPNADGSTVHGAFKIANLSIWIWATKKEDGYYQIESFFTPHQVALFESTDDELLHPICASQYLLLNKDAFAHTSNMDYEAVKTDICAMDQHPLLLDSVTNFLLNILCGYDLQKQGDAELLDLAESVCDWLKDCSNVNDNIWLLNKLQITKRRRNLSITEIIELGRLTESRNTPNIRCGAYLLLGETEQAQLCFNELPIETQTEFATYPICHFGTLRIDGGRE